VVPYQIIRLHLLIGTGNNTRLITPKTAIGVVTNKGFIVEAEDLIYVSVRLNAALVKWSEFI
jgi:hypothetical protein